MDELENVTEAIEYIRRKQLKLREMPVGKEIKNYAQMEARAERKKQKEIAEQCRNCSSFNTISEAKFEFTDPGPGSRYSIKAPSVGEAEHLKQKASELTLEKQRALVEKAGKTLSAMGARCFTESRNRGPLDLIKASELAGKETKEKLNLAEGFLSTGTYIFAGAPKVGKSFMMSEIAYCVATGGELLGFKCSRAGVLYLALEDDEARLKSRLTRMFGEELPENLYLTTKAGDIEESFFLQMQYALNEHPDIKLVIVDTLQKIKFKGSSYSSDYQAVGSLKRFADTFGIGMLIVHHTTKTKQADIFNSISGSTGLTGAADGAYVMYKDERISSNAIIDLTGRDLEDRRVYLKRDLETLMWLRNEDEEQQKSPEEELLDEIAALVEAGDGLWEGTPTQLAALLKNEAKTAAFSRKLKANAKKLRELYGIDISNYRTHNDRVIVLTQRSADAPTLTMKTA